MFRIGRLSVSLLVRDLAILAICFCLIYSPLLSMKVAGADTPKLPAKRTGQQAISHAHKQGQLIVKFRPESTAEQRAFVLNAFAKDEKPLRGNSRITRLTLKDGIEVANAVFNARQLDNVVEYAEPNYIVAQSETVTGKAAGQTLPAPNDPNFPKQWALENIGQNNGTFGADIGARTGWQTTTGTSSTIIAVIDTGIDLKHPDLTRNLWINKAEATGKKNEDDDRDGYTDDI
ncbi:MAG: hypothetical protein ABI977_23860 [Acidobacteriota bacterium]